MNWGGVYGGEDTGGEDTGGEGGALGRLRSLDMLVGVGEGD